MSTSGDVESTSNSLPGSAAGSPRSKVKFLCSHGGKILPRPVDGHLKYVGGETRVVSVPRCITFTDLMKKLNCIIEGYDVTLKYQLIPEELDALVSVKSDEDLRHMFEEYDRQNLIGTPRLRTFLFPTSPIVIDNPIGPMDRQSLEQRYINSVNGIMFNPPPIYNNSNSNNNNNAFKASAVNTSQTSFTISSACSSPRTPPEATSSVSTAASSAMTRARSSPNLCNLGASPQPNQQYPYYHHRQPPPPPPPHHLHHMHHHPKPPLDPSPHKNSSPDHHMRMRSPGLTDYYSHSQHSPNPYARSSRSGGHMGYQRGSPYDEYYGNVNRYDRESPPGSPLARSPLQNNYGSKWDPIGGR